MTLHTHAQEFILEECQGRRIFTGAWNSADGLGTIKDLLCFPQGCRDTRDKITREQETKIKDEVVDSKDGKSN